MPSPFPGMDPYLEGNLWSSVHHSLATRIADQLAPKLEPRYVALPERYFLIDTEDEVEIIENLYPDVGVAKASEARMRQRTTRAEPAPVRAPVVMATPVAFRVPHSRIAIRDVEKRRLVTIIEFLSPTNKRGDGRKQYLRKRNWVLRSATSLVEIDLLRKGLRRPCAASIPRQITLLW